MGGLDAAEWDERDRQIAALIRKIEAILPGPMGKQDRAAFEMALTLHFNESVD
jgi:hypothetical protein